MPSTLDVAIRDLLQEFQGNAWFTEQYWPDNKDRALSMVRDISGRLKENAELFEPGCGVGYISYVFAKLGYRVTATDAWKLPERDEMLRRVDAKFFYSNLNHLPPFPDLPGQAFDAVLFGEVFEHLLNHPLGVLRELNRVLRPSGVLILTTPNPCTIMNAARMLSGGFSLWGTDAFIQQPKIVDGVVIDKGDVHYREYRTAELIEALQTTGFLVEEVRYMGIGSSSGQMPIKRFAKRVLRNTLMRQRLFGATQYLIAVKK
jgi:2-polyprenyl-3-methyl-5-hydroxy-6-metoxy-1,4-benzoquinol methylase